MMEDPDWANTYASASALSVSRHLMLKPYENGE